MKSALVILALLSSSEALAQKVVVLELQGDKGGHMRAKVESALIDAGVQVVLHKHTKKLKGPVAAYALDVDFVIDGTFHHTLTLSAWNVQGSQVWNDAIKLHKGGLPSGAVAQLVAALKAKAPEKAPEPEPEPRPKPRAKREPEPAPEPETSEPPPPPVAAVPVPEARPEAKSEEAAEEAAAQGTALPESTAEPTRRLKDEDEPSASRVGPKLITAFLGGSLSWRSYCAWPGVDSCAEYDMAPDPKPAGGGTESYSSSPFLEFQIAAETFPLSKFFDNALKGIGLTGSFSIGLVRQNVTVNTMGGLTSCGGTNGTCTVVSTPRSWSLAAAYRYYFTATGYAGIRVGAESRVFTGDPNAPVPLPGSTRIYPVIQAEGTVPIIRQLNVDVAAALFINPHPGPDETARWGTSSTLGFAFEVGLSGTLFGPVGYRVHLRYGAYFDHYSGGGTQWADKGVGFESYTSLMAGPTLAF
jgi:hypothetical protein